MGKSKRRVKQLCRIWLIRLAGAHTRGAGAFPLAKVDYSVPSQSSGPYRAAWDQLKKKGLVVFDEEKLSITEAGLAIVESWRCGECKHTSYHDNITGCGHYSEVGHCMCLRKNIVSKEGEESV